MLVLGSVGALTAWAHNRSSLLDLLVARDITGLSAAPGTRRRPRAGHCRPVRPARGIRDISAALLFAGPLEVRPLPATVYGLAMVLIVIHVWSAFLQAMTDSTWYSADPPPARAVLVLRPGHPADRRAVVVRDPGLSGVLAASGGTRRAVRRGAGRRGRLLLLPYTVIYELVLRGARDASVRRPAVTGRTTPITVHSLVKNAAYALISEVDKDPGAGAGDQGAGSGDARAERGGAAHGPRPGSGAGQRRAALALRDADLPGGGRRPSGSTRPAVRWSSAVLTTSWPGGAWST